MHGKDIASMAAGIVEGIAHMESGTFAQRNPAKGKMIKCQFCKKRCRETEKCCNPVWTKHGEPKRKGLSL